MYRKMRLIISIVIATSCFANSVSTANAADAVADIDASSTTCKIPFFAMDTGTKDTNHQTPESQAKMLKELGYPGIGWSPRNVPEMLASLDEEGLKMYNVYIGVEIDGPTQAVPSQILKLIDQLEGRDTAIWLYVVNKQYKNPSDEAGDGDAVALLQKIADRAQKTKLEVALYPHAGCWMERVQDAVRLAKKVDRPNLGVIFNLCHCIKVGDEKKIPKLLEIASPYLLFVTINGADHTGSWGKLIQPLDQGEFDVVPLLKKLKQLDYTGPIGLQHYGIGGNVKKNLKRSLDAWHSMSSQIWK